MAAFQELATTGPDEVAWVESKLDPKLAAFMTGDSYTPDEIEDCTGDILACVPQELAGAPTVRTYLRYWWYWMTQDGAVPDDALFLYSAAGCVVFGWQDSGCVRGGSPREGYRWPGNSISNSPLMRGFRLTAPAFLHRTHCNNRLFAQLSLLDHQLCTTAPSLVAAAALGLSMRAFSVPGWQRLLAGFTAYSQGALEATMAALALLQEQAEVSLFRQYYLNDAKGREMATPEVAASHPAGYERALQLISKRCAVLPAANARQ